MPVTSKYIWVLDVFLIAITYLIAAGFLYGILYRWKKNYWLPNKVQQRIIEIKQVNREIRFSLMSMAIYAVTGFILYQLRTAGYTRVYMDIHEYGIGYFVVSILLMVFIHDTYFYWTHRLLHLPKIFRAIHRTHHLSTQPTPWAAFAFHPAEAIIQAGIVPLIVFTIPSHPWALFIFLAYMTLINVAGHSGYELIPSGFRRTWIGRLHNATTYHDNHHHYGKGNYGLYFTIWDRLMKTFRS